MDKEQRLHKYRSLDDAIKKAYESTDLANLARSLTKTHKLSNYSVFINLIGDTILGFYKTKELPQLLQKETGVSADVAQKIVGELTEFLSPVLAREAEEENKHQVQMKALQENMETHRTVAAAETPSVPPAEIAVDSVQPMRTMEGDVTRIHGYGAYRNLFPDERGEQEYTEEVIKGASQETILQEKPKLAEQPHYTEE